MDVSSQNIESLIEYMIHRIHRDEMPTEHGISFLEMKYQMLLDYLINLTLVILKKISGKRIEADPCIDRLVEIRTVIEKIRPIENKLKYEIAKLVKSGGDDRSTYRANPDNLIENLDENDHDSDSSDKPVKKPEVYIPPKLAAVHYLGDETSLNRSKKAEERKKKRALSSAIMQDLREEYLDIPLEVCQTSQAQNILSRQQQEREEYEEAYLTRLPITKVDKHKRRQLSTLGTLGDEVTSFRNSNRGNKRKHQKRKGKKSFKKKRSYK